MAIQFDKFPVNQRAVRINRIIDRLANRGLRTYDRWMGRLRLGGRKAAYDDEAYEFVGGAQDGLRRRHWDRSLRLLWKAEEHAPWSSFHDCSDAEKSLFDQAIRDLTEEEATERHRITSPEFRQQIQEVYSLREREALVSILSAIGHGEAYAWMTSAELLTRVQSTGAKAAVTAQVLEEAKHFIVLRELVHAFGVDPPPLSAWEYLLLERVLKSRGLEKLFGMNVVVEGIALSFFGLLCHLPGLEILRLFHLDESRHTALPVNYFSRFGQSVWAKHNPISRLRRTLLVLPAIPMIFRMEEDVAELGFDVFQVAGGVIRRIMNLSRRSGFGLALPHATLGSMIDLVLNGYCYLTRPTHAYRSFLETAEAGPEELLQIEQAAIEPAPAL